MMKVKIARRHPYICNGKTYKFKLIDPYIPSSGLSKEAMDEWRRLNDDWCERHRESISRFNLWFKDRKMADEYVAFCEFHRVLHELSL